MWPETDVSSPFADPFASPPIPAPPAALSSAAAASPARAIPIGVFRALPGQLHKGEMWTEASDRNLRQLLPLPGLRFPPCNSRQDGVMMLRRMAAEPQSPAANRSALVWVTASTERMQPIYHVAPLPEQDPWPIFTPLVERLRGAREGELEALGEIRINPESDRQSARRSLELTLGLIAAIQKNAQNNAMSPSASSVNRPIVYSFKRPVELPELAAVLSIYAAFIAARWQFRHRESAATVGDTGIFVGEVGSDS